MRVIFFSKMAFGKFGESGESVLNCWANVGKSGEYLPSRLANVGASAHDKIGHFMHK
jgi:hypothetical protein